MKQLLSTEKTAGNCLEVLELLSLPTYFLTMKIIVN